jgi:hypothetical protein
MLTEQTTVDQCERHRVQPLAPVRDFECSTKSFLVMCVRTVDRGVRPMIDVRKGDLGLLANDERQRCISALFWQCKK